MRKVNLGCLHNGSFLGGEAWWPPGAVSRGPPSADNASLLGLGLYGLDKIGHIQGGMAIDWGLYS